ncbi:MAG: DUF4292 domain-containing protein [Chitinophagaceae bacterium]|nr:MAG: hypothetical protein UZ11_BCD004001160 [Bacteroidetes bacterium OLB11]MCC6447123.1 DUF4292 domain-containing protein [Chitinophagaceae bacterium]HMN32654.1 DUF4292 domain-containing protein [Chitinophagaceae bacterium]
MTKIGMKNSTLFLFIFIMFLSSCKLVRPFFVKNEKKETRKEKREEKKTDVVITPKDTLSLPAKDTIAARKMIEYRQLEYNTIQLKAKMHYESNNQKQSFNIHFRLKNNETIWASISAPIIGELARAIITPDSVKALDRFNKKYYLYSYSELIKLINIDVEFSTLQQIIIGNAIATDGPIKDIQKLAGLSTFVIKSNDYINQLTYNNTDSTLRLLQLQTARPISTSSILINFYKYEAFNQHLLSIQRSYHIQDLKGASTLDMDINKYEIDIPIDFPYSVPANYKFGNK